MPENAIIPSQTTVSTTGSIINILTQYIGENMGGVAFAFIMEVDGGQIVNGIPFEMGEGGIVFQNIIYMPTFSVNANGDLIVTAADSANFNVDTLTGQLQYIT